MCFVVLCFCCSSCGVRGTQSKAAETEMVPSTKVVEFRFCSRVVLLCCFWCFVLFVCFYRCCVFSCLCVIVCFLFVFFVIAVLFVLLCVLFY